MKILIFCKFYPSIGGIETLSSLLASEWCKLGADVVVCTDVKQDKKQNREYPYRVINQPSAIQLLKLFRWCEVYLQYNISLKAIWPLLFIHRPIVVSHQSYYWLDRTGRRNWRENLKLKLASLFVNVYASKAIANQINQPGHIIPNPYDSSVFYEDVKSSREAEVAYVGRLVSDKGIDILLLAVERLYKSGIHFSKISIIGDGEERSNLEQLSSQLGLSEFVQFLGAKTQYEISELLRDHKILVVPSLWAEPFGIVALEGLASGCRVIVSDKGGLPEAIGVNGVTFPNGDFQELADAIKHVLVNYKATKSENHNLLAHLENHKPNIIANRYFEILDSVRAQHL